jgi:hypothetical protein
MGETDISILNYIGTTYSEATADLYRFWSLFNISF